MKKISAVLITSIVFIVLLTMTVFGAGTNKGNATLIETNQPYQSNLALLETEWYKIIPNETQYYRFHILNQSVELRTGIANGYLDDFVNFFQGYLTVTVRDQYDMTLAEYDVRCGYEGRISLKLEKDRTYYVFVNSTVTGNYRLTATKLADIGADTWSNATSTISNAQMISAIDATSDSDWFTFNAEPERAYYTFNLENISGTSTMNFILYQYVSGAGEFPMREIKSISVGRNSTNGFTLQLEENSKYYYRIYGNGSCTGGYQLDITMRLDAAGNSMDEAYSVKVGEKYISSFDGTGDVDFYRFKTSKSSAYYHLEANNITGKSFSMGIVDANGNEVASDFGKKDLYFNKKLSPDTDYYIRIEGSYSDYQFKLTEKSDIYADEMNDASAISFGKEYKSSFDGDGDRDYVKFTTGSSDAYYHLEAKNITGAAFISELFDGNGNILADSYARNISYDRKLDPNTTYYIVFKGSNSDYSFKLTEKKDAYADEMEYASVISLGKEYKSSFDGTYDTDYVKFTTGKYGAYYHLEANIAKGVGFDADLFDSNGNNIFNKFDQKIAYDRKLEPNSTYYIHFRGSNSEYSFKLTEKIDAYADEMNEATTITVGKEYTSYFEGSEDCDYVKFTTGKENAYYYLEMKNISGDWSYAAFVDEDGNHFVRNTGYTIYLNAKLEPNTTYYALLKGGNSKYKFKLTRKVDAESDEKEGAKSVKINSLTDGRLEVQPDVDWFKVTVSSAGNYRIRFINYCGGPASVNFYDKRGTSLCYIYAYGDENRFVFLDPGTYYMRVWHTYSEGEYSFVLASCGDGHKATYSYPVKSTMSRDGQRRETCSKCKANIGMSTVAKIDSVKLSTTTYTYNGKTKTPSVTVKDSNGKKLKSGTDYTVTYPKKRKSIGKYTVTVTFKGKYSGTKKLTFSIVPAKVTLSKVTAGSKQLTATWKTVSGATGYEVVYSTSKKFTKKTTKTVTIKKAKTKKTTIKKLSKGKKYYVKVRAYKTVSGKKIYGAWSAVKNVKVK